MNNPNFPAADVRALFGQALPVTAREGLRYSGGAQGAIIMPEVSLPTVTDPVYAAEPSAATDPHNWKPTKVDDTHLTISSGNAAGAVATIGGVSLDNATPPQLTVSATDLVYVYVCVTFSLDIAASGVVSSGTVTSRAISAESAEQTNTDTARWFLLFKWQAGRLVEQKLTYSFEMNCEDDGYAHSVPAYQTWPSA
ncbi:hypothetical protein [Prosthecobacter sp.]|uniref:hypothetical protein n=1 Tax=Prosthecobacter sp. TaxID=1965333 RepID=UPI0037831281